MRVALMVALAAVLMSAGVAHADTFTDVVSCGGFVRPSAAIKKAMGGSVAVDFSDVHVKLYNSAGQLKETTECAPNGYFFLPAYEAGKYELRAEGPVGWTLEPASFVVDVAANEECNGGGAIDFVISGFSVHGALVGADDGAHCAAPGKGPAGVTVQLRADGSEAVVGESVTSEGGSYTLDNVAPGTYNVHVEGGGVEGALAGQVTVAWGSAHAPALHVDGYDVVGRVEARSGEPMVGVTVTLTGAVERSAESDASGTFRMGGVPCGKYTATASYVRAATTYDVAPVEGIEVVVGHGTAHVAQPFQVTGFSMGGRVVDSAGAGMARVAIAMNGEARAVTAADGTYRLDRLESGVFTITAALESYTFTELSNVHVAPTMASLEDITVATVAVCGTHRLTTASPTKRSVEVRAIGGGDGDATQTIACDANGAYCAAVAPGATYEVRAVLSSAERAAGMVLKPLVHTIPVDSTPVRNVDFTQSLLSVSGRVHFAAAPTDDVHVTMLQGGRVEDDAVVDSSGAFVFSDVVPGTHMLRIAHGDWCWHADEVSVDVASDNVDDVEFVHTGFGMAIDVSHAISLDVQRAGSDVVDTLELVAGKNVQCVAQPGLYTLTPRSCFRFGAESYEFDTVAPHALHLAATHTLVTGSVVTTVAPEGKVNVALRPLGGDADEADGAVFYLDATLDEAATAGSDKQLFRYKYWAEWGERIEVTPSCKNLLFYPRTQEVHVVQRVCPEPVPKFVGKTGLYVGGRIEPVLPGVSVRVQLPLGDGNVVTHAVVEVSEEDGTYMAGPLYDNQAYTLEPEKAGYTFEADADDDTLFHATKLARVDVRVVDTDGNALDNVLLSLGGGDAYRGNAKTSDEGEHTFFGLMHGSYFLKPLLKEYKFEPASAVFDVHPGGDEAITFVGTRVAFSCFGTTRSLTGDVERGVEVEAFEAGNEADSVHETTQSDDTGAFRLRGLQPGKTYTVRVKASPTSRNARASPAEHTVTMGTEDVEGLAFVVFRRTQAFDVTVHVHVPEEHRKATMVSLETESGDAVDSVKLSYTPHVHFGALPKGKYVVRANALVDVVHMSASTPSVTVEVGPGAEHAVATLDVDVESRLAASEDGAPASVLWLIVLCAAVWSAFNRKQATALAKQGWAAVRELQQGGAGGSSGGAGKRRRKKNQ